MELRTLGATRLGQVLVVEITADVESDDDTPQMLRLLADWIEEHDVSPASVTLLMTSHHWNEAEDEWVLRATVEMMS